MMKSRKTVTQIQETVEYNGVDYIRVTRKRSGNCATLALVHRSPQWYHWAGERISEELKQELEEQYKTCIPAEQLYKDDDQI